MTRQATLTYDIGDRVRFADGKAHRSQLEPGNMIPAGAVGRVVGFSYVYWEKWGKDAPPHESYAVEFGPRLYVDGNRFASDFVLVEEATVTNCPNCEEAMYTVNDPTGVITHVCSGCHAVRYMAEETPMVSMAIESVSEQETWLRRVR